MGKWTDLKTYTNFKDWPFWVVVIIIVLLIVWYLGYLPF